ncbi:hypothetical protein CgunFtcFv8_023831 [Champsocephalus gunnari]|uniref:Uncharacterized protein n=1 Tax=Champsocephalus gunnari TaxID=52237 RepID=A0AAN8HL88_CHAGU|nr:hypothetical protein CgunFtcFv8_023831 [Champsocephalus gunnari]
MSYVNLQKLVPVIISIVDGGVIVLLLGAADKPLEESGLLWILSGGRQTGSVGSDRKPGGCVGSSRFSSLSLCTMTQLVKRRQKQQTGTDINTCHHHLNKQLAGRSDLQQLTVLRAQAEFRRSDKTSDCGGARLKDFRFCFSIQTFLTLCSPITASSTLRVLIEDR